MEVGGGEGGDAGDDDIVVDDQPLPPAQVVPPACVRPDAAAYSSTDKLMSLEQAILASIERCRKSFCCIDKAVAHLLMLVLCDINLKI